jgi:hypothetical protein
MLMPMRAACANTPSHPRASSGKKLSFYACPRQADNEFYGQVGHGDTDHASWGRPQDLGDMWCPSYKIDTSNPGSDLAGEAAAALAAASIAFNATNSSLAKGYLKHAEQLYEFASTYTGCLGRPAKRPRNSLLPPQTNLPQPRTFINPQAITQAASLTRTASTHLPATLTS